MFLIKDSIENTIVIQKSIFICRIYRVNNIDEVNELLNEIRKKHYDATHNCYAYILGQNQEIQKASDDGEPQKTAGWPMLDVLKKKNLTNVLAIVTRYFGGVLLGSGGLIRAYSASVVETLDKTTFYIQKLQANFMLTTSYSGYNTIISVLKNITIINVSFQSDVILECACDKEYIKNLENDLYKYKIDAITITLLPDSIIEVIV